MLVDLNGRQAATGACPCRLTSDFLSMGFGKFIIESKTKLN